MIDKDGKLDERSQRILSEQTIPPRYGRSPAITALGLNECIVCNGTGSIDHTARIDFSTGEFKSDNPTFLERCPACKGTGQEGDAR